MNTTADKLQGILDSKAAIKSAIEAKGVTVGDAPLDEYAGKIADIQQGGGLQEAPENDVNFYDYDGFRVASYTIAEAKALTELPTPPTHEGLTFQEWNWTLNDISNYNRRYIDVGANYVTTDGKTHMKVVISGEVETSMTFKFKGTLTVDWGDGQAPDSIYNNKELNYTFNHIYSAFGEYIIKISFLGDEGDKYGFINRGSAYTWWKRNMNIVEVNCGENFTFSYNSSFTYIKNYCLLSIATDTVLTSINTQYSHISTISIPRTTGAFGNGNFSATLVYKICFPKSVDTIWSNGMFASLPTNKLVLPETSASVTSATVFNSTPQLNILSVPMSWNNAIATVEKYDIVNGWIPSVNLTLNSQYMLAVDIVDFFNKLGTTTNTITLTFGSTNLDKLTAEEKAIANNKGYTLA